MLIVFGVNDVEWGLWEIILEYCVSDCKYYNLVVFILFKWEEKFEKFWSIVVVVEWVLVCKLINDGIKFNLFL